MRLAYISTYHMDKVVRDKFGLEADIGEIVLVELDEEGSIIRMLGSDFADPEDHSFCRAWAWVKEEILDAYRRGVEEGSHNG